VAHGRPRPRRGVCAVQVEETDEWDALVNRNSKFETPAVGDVNMAALKKGDIIQLERKVRGVVWGGGGGC